MNNYEKIRQMSVDEMAKHYAKISKSLFNAINLCIARDGIELESSAISDCQEVFKKWLESEEE